MPSPSTINDPQSTIRDRTSDPEVLVRVNGVSKKFCRDLKKSLWYGVKDVASELLPFGKRAERREQGDARGEEEALNITERSSTSSSHPLTFRDSCLHAPALRPGEFWANKDISFELRRGECLGLIGHNGAGKTTLLKMLNGLIKPDVGSIEMRGRVGALIALGAGFNPILTGRENIYVYGSVIGLTKAEIDNKLADIIDFAEIREFIDSPVQSYSSGMQVRLGFSVASSLSPDILLLDEVLAVGDNAFKVKCLKRVSELRRTCATIFVSHEAFQISKISSRILWLDHGRTLRDSGDVNGTLSEYERMGITRSMSENKNKEECGTNGYTIEVNGKPLNHVEIAMVAAQEPVVISISLDPLQIPPDIDRCQIRTSILDTAGSPVASVQSSEQVSHHVVTSDRLRHGTSIRVHLRDLPLADGVYHLRLSIVAEGTDDYMFYAERAGSITVHGYGHGWCKTILGGSWMESA